MTFTADTPTEATANVSGLISDLVTDPDVAVILFYFSDNDFIAWNREDANNSLKSLEVGKKYTVMTTATVDMPIFSSTDNDSTVAKESYVMRGETEDNNPTLLPAITVVPYSMLIVKVSLTAKSSDAAYQATKELSFSISVDSAGDATIEDQQTNYEFNADSNFTFDLGTTGKIIPQITNTTALAGYFARWAVAIEVLTIGYTPSL